MTRVEATDGATACARTPGFADPPSGTAVTVTGNPPTDETEPVPGTTADPPAGNDRCPAIASTAPSVCDRDAARAFTDPTGTGAGTGELSADGTAYAGGTHNKPATNEAATPEDNTPSTRARIVPRPRTTPTEATDIRLLPRATMASPVSNHVRSA